MARPSISLVIPALNEERGIVATLKRVPKEISEVIVVDGGSKDRTVELAEANGARVLVEKKRGYGLAYKRGFAEAKGEVVTTCDADGTYPIELFPYVVDYLVKRDLTFVNCSRLPLVDSKSMRFWNRLGNVGLSLAASALYLHPFRDISSGMWAFRREFIDKLELHTDGWCFSNEIKLEAYTVNPRGFAEFVIPFDERVGDTHNVTIWATGVEVLGFMAYERFLHFMRARVVDKSRSLATPIEGLGSKTDG
ncbi:MAG TPA: glycosyltransferase family 2 protein [Polyangiaceae bacterium]|jgi:glycosyltransferase involved in cell wall biosynthesis|nr:glycosyltransferase family 2 protein [Polyangiaceae bacterium]